MTLPVAALVDTNWYVAALKGQVSLPSIRLYSVITRLEILSWSGLDAAGVQGIQTYLSRSEEIPLSDEIVLLAAEFRRRFGGKLPDAVVAASAAHYEAPLLTFDRGMARYASRVAIVGLV